MNETTTAELSPPTGPESATRAPSPAPSGRRRRRRARVRNRRARYGISGIDRVNRCVLALVGLVLIAAGVVGLLSDDRLDLRPPARLYQDAASDIVDARAISLTIVLVIAIVLLLAGLAWSWAQVSPASGDGRISTTTVARTKQGVTTLEPVSAAKALSSDLETVDGVTRAGVRVISVGSRPDVIATVDIRRDVDLRHLRRDLDGPLDRFLAATGTQELDVELRFRIVGQDGPRVI